MANDRRNLLFNILTYAVLVATLGLVIYYALIGFGVQSLNPLPPSESSGLIFPNEPTDAPTPSRIATWTPTPIPTDTPIPSPTNTRPPTLTPSTTPTPKVTRNPDWPFTCEVLLRMPEYGAWTGVAGHLQDLDGNPLPGYLIRVEGPIPNLPPIRAGADPRINAIYGSDAAWEQAFNPSAFQPMEVRVQVFAPVGESLGEAVSDVVIVELRGYASSSLGYVTCTLNWEDWP